MAPGAAPPALNPLATAFVPGPQAAQPAQQPPPPPPPAPATNRRRRNRQRRPVQQAPPSSWEAHVEEDWTLNMEPAEQPTQPGRQRRRGRKKPTETRDDDAWTIVSASEGTSEWSVPSRATTAWITPSVAPSLAGDELGDAVAADAAEAASDTTCTVCCEPLGAADLVVSMRACEHVFHRECLWRWLTQHSQSCPNCRTPAPLASLVTLAPLSADALAQLAGGGGGGGGGGTARGGGGGPQHAGLADLAGPGGGDASGRGGGEGGAAGVAWAEPSPAEASELWEGSVFDDGASVVSGVSFTSVTTARGWPRVAPPAPGAAAPTGMGHASYAEALISREAEAKAEAAAEAAAAAEHAAATRPALARLLHARARPAGAAAGTRIVQGRVLLAPKPARTRSSRRAVALSDMMSGALERVEEEEDDD